MRDLKNSTMRFRLRLLAGCAATPLAFAPCAMALAQVPVFQDSPTANIAVIAPVSGGANGVYTITQTGARGIANWTSFDVGAGLTVRVDILGVPDPANAITLNRVVTGPNSSPSRIDGRIESPGQFWLVNQRGVYIGKSGAIDVAAFLASSADLHDADFLSEQNQFEFVNGGGGPIINEGTITTHGGTGASAQSELPPGYVVLSGAGVSHQGLIGGEVTHVVIGGAEAFVLRIDGSGVNYQISKELASNPGQLFAAVEVSGEIRAGKRVLLTAAAIDRIYDSAVNMDGVIEGSEVVISAAGDVNITGVMAVTEDIEINVLQTRDADGVVVRGNLDFAGAADAGQDIRVAVSGDMAISASATAGRDFTVQTAGDSRIYGLIDAGRDLKITTQRNSFFSGVAAAGNDATFMTGGGSYVGGVVDARRDVNLSAAGDLFVSGVVSAGNNISAAATRDAFVSGVIDSGSNFSLDVGGYTGISGDISAGADAVVVGIGDIEIYSDSESGSEATISAGAFVMVRGQADIFAEGAVRAGVDAEFVSALNTQTFGLISAGQDVIISAGDTIAHAAQTNAGRDVVMAARNDITIDVGSFSAATDAGRDILLTAGNLVGVYGPLSAGRHAGAVSATFVLSGQLMSESEATVGFSPSGSIDAQTVSVAADGVDILGSITADAAYFTPYLLADIFLGGASTNGAPALYFRQADLDAVSAPQIIFDAAACECGRTGGGGSIFINGDISFGAANPAQNSVFLFGQSVAQQSGAASTGSPAGRIAAPVLGVGAAGLINLGTNRDAIGVFAAESAAGAVDFANAGPLIISASLTAAAIPEANFAGWNAQGVHAGLTSGFSPGQAITGPGGDLFGIRIDNSGALSILGGIVSDASGAGVLALATGDVLVDAAVSSRGSINETAAYPTDIVITSTAGEFSAGANSVFSTAGGRFLIFTGSPTASDLSGVSATPYFNTTFDPNAASSPDVAGDRLVFRAPAELNFETVSRTREYGDPNPDFANPDLGIDLIISGGFADYLQAFLVGSPVLSTTATQASNVGLYPIAIDYSSLNLAEFNVSAVATIGVLTVTPAPIVVTATGAREYGLANDFSSVSLALAPGSSLRLGQSLGEILTLNPAGFSTDASQNSNVGDFTLFGATAWTPIIPSGVTRSNYDISFTDGVYSVTPAPLTLLVSGSGVAGLFSLNDILIQPSVFTPLRLNDTVDSIATYVFSTAAGPTAGAGEYSIITGATASIPAGATRSNYDISILDGVISIARNSEIDTSAPPLTDPDAVKDTLADGRDRAGEDGDGGLPRSLETPVEDTLLPGDDLLYRSTIANNGNDGIW